MAGRLSRLYQQHRGRPRAELTVALREAEADSLDYPIIRGLAAVLDARCTWANEAAVPPAELRSALFQQGPVFADADRFGGETRTQRLAEAAAAYKVTPQQIERSLFADLAEEQILLDAGDPIAPGDLIHRYNLEVARGLLYWARELHIQVWDGYKDLFKYIKLFKLMHTIRPQPAGGYAITLHGPLSPFVRSTLRYGLQFARFMPALLLGRRWQMQGDIRLPGRKERLLFSLNDGTPLRSHFVRSGEFDSQLEADFAAEFEAKYGRADRVWELTREDELILVGDTVMIPDFSFTHRRDGRRVLLEIVGFWHPNYLQRKLDKVRRARRQDLILLVYEGVNVAAEEFEAASAGEVVMFKNKPILKEVLAAIERTAVATA